MKHPFVRLAAMGGFALAAALVPAAAPAQTPDPGGHATSAPGNLPTFPNAQRATEGGETAGHPSLAGVNGSSPLEPYLVTWLLPVSGILVALVVVGADRALRARVRTGAPPRRAG